MLTDANNAALLAGLDLGPAAVHRVDDPEWDEMVGASSTALETQPSSPVTFSRSTHLGIDGGPESGPDDPSSSRGARHELVLDRSQ